MPLRDTYTRTATLLAGNDLQIQFCRYLHRYQSPSRGQGWPAENKMGITSFVLVNVNVDVDVVVVVVVVVVVAAVAAVAAVTAVAAVAAVTLRSCSEYWFYGTNNTHTCSPFHSVR